MTVTELPAATLPEATVSRYLVAEPAVVVIDGLVPASDVLSVAFTECVVDVVAVVKTTVATPLAFVDDVGEPNDPPLVLDQVTVLPAVATRFPFASVSCALIVTDVPAIGVEFVAVTRYCVAAPGLNVTSALFVMPVDPAVPVTVAPPDVVPVVRVAV